MRFPVRFIFSDVILVNPLPKQPVERTRLSTELAAIVLRADEPGLTLGVLMRQLEGRVYTLLLVLLSVPFCQPITIPGFSTPFGVVLALLGLRFAFRQKPWLPKRLADTHLPPKLLRIVLGAAAKVLGWIEKALHPRMSAVFDYRVTQFAAGLTIFFCGLLLLLPLPVPLSNLFPALTIVIVAASVAERDGLMLGVGGGLFVVTLLFFAAILIGGVELAEWLKEWLGGFFDAADEAPGLLPSSDS